jgi:hypothetical protein
MIGSSGPRSSVSREDSNAVNAKEPTLHVSGRLLFVGSRHGMRNDDVIATAHRALKSRSEALTDPTDAVRCPEMGTRLYTSVID